MPKKQVNMPTDFGLTEVTSLAQHEYTDPATIAKRSEEAVIQNVLSVANYELTDIYPDFYQTRGEILPCEINYRLQTGKVTHQQALTEWENLVKENGYKDLTWDNLVKLSQDIKRDKLLHPIQIYMDTETRKLFIIDGERRFWATWLLQIETDNYRTIPAQMHPGPSVRIQVTANSDNEEMSPVGLARQYARTYLDKLGSQPDTPKGPEDYWDYYKRVLLGTQELIGKGKLPTGFWEEIEHELGIGRPTILYYFQLFAFDQTSLSLAHKYNLSVYILEEILKAPHEEHERLITLVATKNLSLSTLEQLVKYSTALNKKAYFDQLNALTNNNTTQANNSERGRSRRDPTEAQYAKSIQFIHGIKKVTSGDYRGVAGLIAGNLPEEAENIAAEYRKLAEAIENELNNQ